MGGGGRHCGGRWVCMGGGGGYWGCVWVEVVDIGCI